MAGLESRQGGLGQGHRELAPVVWCLTFQAQVALQAHRPFISFFSFNVLHPWQDDRRWSWGAPVPSISWKETILSFPRTPDCEGIRH